MFSIHRLTITTAAFAILSCLSAIAQTTTPAATSPADPVGIDLPQEFNNTFQIILIHKPAAQVAAKLGKPNGPQKPIQANSLGEAFAKLKPVGGKNSGFYEPAIFLLQLKGQPWTIWYGSNLYGDSIAALHKNMQAEVIAYGYEDTSGSTYLMRYKGGKELGQVEDADSFILRGDPTDGDEQLMDDLHALGKAAEALHRDILKAKKKDYKKVRDERDRIFSRIVASAGAYLPRFVYEDKPVPGARPNPVPKTPNGNGDVESVYVIRKQ